jgi:hypothetical protein
MVHYFHSAFYAAQSLAHHGVRPITHFAAIIFFSIKQTQIIMAKTNKVSISIKPADMTAMLEAVTLLKSKLPFLLVLLPQERKTLTKMGDKSVAFVTKALEYAATNPDLVPAFLDVAEFDKDIKVITELLKIVRPLEQLQIQLEDTLMQAGVEANEAALFFYNNSKVAAKAGVPGAEPIYLDLKERFPGKQKKNKPDKEKSLAEA